MKIIEIQIDNDITHIALEGRLDVIGLHAVDVKFHGYTAARRKPTLVDLAQLEFIASLAMGMLISCAKSLQRNRVKMILYGPPSAIEEALRVVGIDQVIPIVKTQEEALRLLMDEPS